MSIVKSTRGLFRVSDALSSDASVRISWGRDWAPDKQSPHNSQIYEKVTKDNFPWPVVKVYGKNEEYKDGIES